MNASAFVKEMNSAYLTLLDKCNSDEKHYSEKIMRNKRLEKETNAYYDELIQRIQTSTEEEAQRIIDDKNKEVNSAVKHLERTKKEAIDEEKKLHLNVSREYDPMLSELKEKHEQALFEIEARYNFKINKNKRAHEYELLILNNSFDLERHGKSVELERMNRNRERLAEQNKGKLEAGRDKLNAALDKYERDIIEILTGGTVGYGSLSGASDQLIEAVKECYGSGVSDDTQPKSIFSFSSNVPYDERKKEIDTYFGNIANEIASERNKGFKDENAKYSVETERISALKADALHTDRSASDIERQIDDEIEETKKRLRKDIDDRLADLKADTDASIRDAEEAREEKLDEIKKERKLLESDLNRVKKESKERKKDFLIDFKTKLEELFEVSCSYKIGLNNDYIGANEIPESICIGGVFTEIADCELTKALYGDNKLGYEMPVNVNLKQNGNIVINASMDDEDSDELYRIVSGMTIKYMQTYPLRSLRVHFLDANPSYQGFDKFMNAFAQFEEASDKNLVTSTQYLQQKIEQIKMESDLVSGKISGEIRDLYDLYQVDKSYPFHLVVIRNGFAEMLETSSIETLRNLKALFGERGRKHGVRFIIVNDFGSIEKLDERRKIQIKEILSCENTFDFKDGKIKFNKDEISCSMITDEDSMKFIEDTCQEMIDCIKSMTVEKISYEEIGFNEEIPDKYDNVLSIPVGMSGAERYSLPFNCGGKGYKNHGCMVLGRPRRGKSSFFHSLIINGSMKYSPDDLQFWLLDFKNGSSSSTYKTSGIPHIRLLSTKNKVADAYCLLKLLGAEMERRSKLLERAGIKARGVNFENIVAYNKYVDEHPEDGEHLGRIIVLMDEAQDMFINKDGENDNMRSMGALIGDITSKGAFAGIHLVIIAQDLSNGNCSELISSFVKKVDAKIAFNLPGEFLRDSGYNEAMVSRRDDVERLRVGEAIAMSHDGAVPQKVRMAFCEESDLATYFEKIRAKYPNHKSKMLVIGNNTLLTGEDICPELNMRYADIIENPIVEKISEGYNSYRFAIGEDAYSLNPATVNLRSGGNGTVIAVGDNGNIASSVAISLLKGVAALPEKLIYACDGENQNCVFDNAASALAASDPGVKVYNPVDIDVLLKDVYAEYVRRRRLQEARQREDHPPMFVFINKVSEIEKIENDESMLETVAQSYATSPKRAVPEEKEKPKPNLLLLNVDEDEDDDYVSPEEYQNRMNMPTGDIFSQGASMLENAVKDYQMQMKVNENTYYSAPEEEDDGMIVDNDPLYKLFVSQDIKTQKALANLCAKGGAVDIYIILTAHDMRIYSLSRILESSQNVIAFNNYPVDATVPNVGSLMRDMLNQMRNEDDGAAAKSMAASYVNGVLSKIRFVSQV